MFSSLYKLFSFLNGDRAKEYAYFIWNKARFSSWDKFDELSLWYAQEMKKIGLEEVELIKLPADGKTSFGGILMPKRWEVKEAQLKIISPYEKVLSNFKDCPCSLMTYSASTPSEGIISELVSQKSKNIKGKVVFGSIKGKLSCDELINKGAIGIISDKVERYEKDKVALKEAVQWHNYSLNPFKGSPIFGFSLSPLQGEKIRKLINQHKKIKIYANVQTKTYSGRFLLPTGLIPGKTSLEVVLTGHLFEQGANDNASGCGLSLEIMRYIKELIERGKIPRPYRGIRLLPSLEVRGMQAYIYKYKSRIPLMVAGLDLDMVGEEEQLLHLCKSPVANSAYTDYLIEDLLNKFYKDKNSLWVTKSYDINDNLLSDPFINAPTPVLEFADDIYWHTSLDTPEKVYSQTLKKIGIVAASYLYFIANAGYKEAKWMIDLIDKKMQIEKYTPYKLHTTLYSVSRLIPNKIEQEKLRKYIEKVEKSLLKGAIIEPLEEIPENLKKKANKLYPMKNFLGFVGFDDLDQNQSLEYKRITGEKPGWISSRNINSALFYSNGKRSLLQILQLLREEERFDLKKFMELFQFLERQGLVLMR